MERFQPVSPAPNQPNPYGVQVVHGQMPSDDSGDEIDLRALLLTLWRGKWIIFVTTLFLGVMGFLYAAQLEPEYRASAKVLFDTQRANVDAGEAVVEAASIDSRSGMQNQVEILRSASLIRRVIEEQRLERNPVFNPDLRPKVETWRDRITLPPELEDLLITLGLSSPPAPPPSEEEAAIRLEKQIINKVLEGLSLNPIRNSEVIEISFVSNNPRLSAAIVNSVSQQYIVDQLEGKLETFRSGTQWLTERVSELQQRVQDAESAVLAAQAAVADEVGATLEATREQLVSLRVARGAARAETSELQAAYDRLREALERGTAISNLSELRESREILALSVREDELRQSDSELAATLLPGHPSRARIAQELDEVRTEMQMEAGIVLESLGRDLETAQAKEIQLTADMDELEDQALQLSTESVEIGNLEREAQASRILFENLLARLQETNAQEELQTADARVLTPAEPPLGPIQSAKRRILAISIVLGALLGTGLVILLDRLNNTFRSPHQLEQMTAQPVLSTIPMAGSSMKRNDVIEMLREKPNSSLAESVRNLRTSILFSNVDEPPQVVMFSSSVPREGKSTTSMLTALTSKQMGKSAIIVDCDLRMPALSKVLRVDEDTPGLLSVLNGTASVEEAIYKEPNTGLHVLMTRTKERDAKINAADVLASERFRQLIKDLCKEYDLVVLDTPPTLVVTDARIISELADAVVFAVKWDSTPRAAVQEGIRELTSVNAKMIGVVMTLVNEQRASKYAYDGYSYYKGQYRDYYEV